MKPDRPRILVAHALTSYAEALAFILAEERPFFDVQLIATANLDAELTTNAGAVVVTDRLTPSIQTYAGGWLLYYPDQENVAVVGGQGSARFIALPSFPDILASIDDLVARHAPVPLFLDAIGETAEPHK